MDYEKKKTHLEQDDVCVSIQKTRSVCQRAGRPLTHLKFHNELATPVLHHGNLSKGKEKTLFTSQQRTKPKAKTDVEKIRRERSKLIYM
jgi:hypothetical protein